MALLFIGPSGNWDIKTKILQQCTVSSMKLASYFMEWINLKDTYLNFYKRGAKGMLTMLAELNIPLRGSHHLEINDAKNIAKVLQRILADGAVLQITARRDFKNPRNVEFLLEERIRYCEFIFLLEVLNFQADFYGMPLRPIF
ncbi:hypothetical protein Droror1_Dr00026593 [Drosera rotundifolia]